MKTPQKTNPINFSIKGKAMAELIKNLKEIQVIHHSLPSYDLGRIKTSISFSSLIKLKLGDTLRVVIYPNEPHLRQAEKALKP